MHKRDSLHHLIILFHKTIIKIKNNIKLYFKLIVFNSPVIKSTVKIDSVVNESLIDLILTKLLLTKRMERLAHKNNCHSMATGRKQLCKQSFDL